MPALYQGATFYPALSEAEGDRKRNKISVRAFPGPKIGTWGTHRWYNFKRSNI
jgi:hypothetical protein